MLQLILKDVLVQKRTVIISIIYVIFFLFAFQKMGPAMFIAGIVAVTYMLVMSACAYEDKNKSDVMMNSLPVSRSVIVGAKYAAAYSYLVFGTIVYTFVITIIRVMNIPIITYPVTLEGIIGAIMAVSLLNGIYLPVFFKMGYTKSKALNFLLFFVFFFGASGLANVIISNKDNLFLQNLAHTFNRLPDVVTASALLMITFLIVMFSFSLSLRFYTRREF